jgi:hypothetical protein
VVIKGIDPMTHMVVHEDRRGSGGFGAIPCLNRDRLSKVGCSCHPEQLDSPTLHQRPIMNRRNAEYLSACIPATHLFSWPQLTQLLITAHLHPFPATKDAPKSPTWNPKKRPLGRWLGDLDGVFRCFSAFFSPGRPRNPWPKSHHQAAKKMLRARWLAWKTTT